MRGQLVILCMVAGVWGVQAPAAAQSIGIFADDCATNCITIPPFTMINFNLSAVPGPAASGLTGASFRVEGLPPGVFLQVSPAPPGIPCDPGPCGDPFSPPGTVVAWPVCRQAPCIRLFDVSAFATAPVPPNTVLRVVARTPPANPAFDCPVIFLCDQTFTLLCVEGLTAVLNPTGSCLIATAGQSWSQIKRLYD